MKIKINFILYLLSFIFIFSCNSKKSEINHDYRRFINSEIIFPDSLLVFNNTKLEDNYKPFKIIFYIDSIGCSECELKKFLILPTLFEKKIIDLCKIIIIFNSHDIIGLEASFIRYSINYPFYLDWKNSFKRINKIPNNKKFHTFLLKNNKVVVIGDPVENERIKKIYNKKLKGNVPYFEWINK